jgi:hypothetical protein
MLHKCANPQCANPFRKLNEGKLYLLEVDDPELLRLKHTGWDDRIPRRIEHFWLCDQCSSKLTLSFDSRQGMVTLPLGDAARRPRVLDGAHLRTVDFTVEDGQEPRSKLA